MKTNHTCDQDRLTELEQSVIQTRQCLVRTQRRLQATWGLLFLLGIGGLLLASVPQAHAQFGITLTSLQNQITALTSRVAAEEIKTQYMSVDTAAQSTTFSGCNLLVNDGGGNTSTIVRNAAGAGLGNLIIGYNGTGRGDGDVRTGSHNLILGDFENYTNFGGIVAGYDNASYANNALAIGGNNNRAYGDLSCILGGGASITGTAGRNSVICGGGANTTNGGNSVVSGGANNTANGRNGVVSGGLNNTASAELSTVSGGANLQQNDFAGWSGGNFHTP